LEYAVLGEYVVVTDPLGLTSEFSEGDLVALDEIAVISIGTV
jgi:hypothetical protein